MKVAISVVEPALTAAVDPRFGRARWFWVTDLDNGETTVVDNGRTLHSGQGAGIQSAQTVVRSGCSIVLTGHLGPKAFRALQAAGIRVFLVPDGKTASEAIQMFRENRLQEASGADVEGHWL